MIWVIMFRSLAGLARLFTDTQLTVDLVCDSLACLCLGFIGAGGFREWDCEGKGILSLYGLIELPSFPFLSRLFCVLFPASNGSGWMRAPSCPSFDLHAITMSTALC